MSHFGTWKLFLERNPWRMMLQYASDYYAKWSKSRSNSRQNGGWYDAECKISWRKTALKEARKKITTWLTIAYEACQKRAYFHRERLSFWIAQLRESNCKVFYEEREQSDQTVELLLQQLQFIAHRSECGHHICRLVYPFTIGIKHFPGCSNLETTHFHKIVNDLYLLNILIGILPDFRAVLRLRTQLWELTFPETQRTFIDTELCSNLLDAVLQL